jgi:hypothetical protein
VEAESCQHCGDALRRVCTSVYHYQIWKSFTGCIAQKFRAKFLIISQTQNPQPTSFSAPPSRPIFMLTTLLELAGLDLHARHASGPERYSGSMDAYAGYLSSCPFVLMSILMHY